MRFGCPWGIVEIEYRYVFWWMRGRMRMKMYEWKLAWQFAWLEEYLSTYQGHLRMKKAKQNSQHRFPSAVDETICIRWIENIFSTPSMRYSLMGLLLESMAKSLWIFYLKQVTRRTRMKLKELVKLICLFSVLWPSRYKSIVSEFYLLWPINLSKTRKKTNSW
jgi:hypothetical protein